MASKVLSRPNVYQSITAKIVTAIEAGAGEYVMPWHGGILSPAFPTNVATGKQYRGINILALWADAALKRYISGHWASYKQWQSLGAQVRKGERGSPIVFYKDIDDPDPNREKKEDNHPHRVARAYTAFNAEQVDGWMPPVQAANSQIEINDAVAAFIAAVDADVRHGFAMARYRRDVDCIEMPAPEAFIGTGTSSPTEAYHGVLLHELTHWVGGPRRLNRVFGRRFGDATYAFEEIIAELGAAFLCSAFRISNEPRLDHARYVKSWLEILNRDTKAIFTAASKAQEAIEYLMDLTSAQVRQ